MPYLRGATGVPGSGMPHGINTPSPSPFISIQEPLCTPLRHQPFTLAPLHHPHTGHLGHLLARASHAHPLRGLLSSSLFPLNAGASPYCWHPIRSPGPLCPNLPSPFSCRCGAPPASPHMSSFLRLGNPDCHISPRITL